MLLMLLVGGKMLIDKMIGFAPILINFVITLISILATYEISKYTINANRKLNEENTKINAENAGKNRVIYETEQMNISQDNKMLKEKLSNMLNSGNYTILSAFVNLGNTTETRFILGKVKP